MTDQVNEAVATLSERQQWVRHAAETYARANDDVKVRVLRKEEAALGLAIQSLQNPHPSRGVVDEAEPGAVASLVAAANATLAANPHDDTMWSLEAAVAPFNASKPAECASGCPPQQVCDYCQVAAKHKLQAALPAVPDGWAIERVEGDDEVLVLRNAEGREYVAGKGGPLFAFASTYLAATPAHDQPEGEG